MTSDINKPVDRRTIFERHPGEWRVFAVGLPAAFAGAWASDVAEQHGLSGAQGMAFGLAVCVSVFLILHPIWQRLLGWLGERRAARPPT